MLESLVSGVLLAACVYLTAGALCAFFLHYRGLSKLDAATANAGWVFRVLITPGMIALWPLLLWRWRQAGQGRDTAGGLERPIPPSGLRRLHSIAIVILIVFCPAVIAAALLVRESPRVHQRVPHAVIEESEYLEYGTNLGQIFPSLPADAQVARTTGRDYGLVFRFGNEAESFPAALYWAPALAEGSLVPPEAVLVGMVWKAKSLWRQFPKGHMAHEGHWILYSFKTHTAESFPATLPDGRMSS